MTTLDEVRTLALQHRRRLMLYFWPTFLASLFLAWLGAWAQHQRGWEAEVLWLLLFSASGLLLMFALFTGVLLYRWYKLSARAFQEAAKYSENPVWFKEVFKEVIGPSPW